MAGEELQSLGLCSAFEPEGIFIVPDLLRRDLYRARPVLTRVFDLHSRIRRTATFRRVLVLRQSQEYRGTFITRYTLTSFNPSRFYLRNHEFWSRVYAVPAIRS